MNCCQSKFLTYIHPSKYVLMALYHKFSSYGEIFHRLRKERSIYLLVMAGRTVKPFSRAIIERDKETILIYHKIVSRSYHGRRRISFFIMQQYECVKGCKHCTAMGKLV